MYDFYPEWGPARNRDDAEAAPRRPRRGTRYWTDRTPAMAGGPALRDEPRNAARDGDRDRPDDN